MTSQTTFYRSGEGPAARWCDQPTSPDDEERMGEAISNRAVPNFINVVDGGSVTDYSDYWCFRDECG